ILFAHDFMPPYYLLLRTCGRGCEQEAPSITDDWRGPGEYSRGSDGPRSHRSESDDLVRELLERRRQPWSLHPGPASRNRTRARRPAKGLTGTEHDRGLRRVLTPLLSRVQPRLRTWDAACPVAFRVHGPR